MMRPFGVSRANPSDAHRRVLRGGGSARAGMTLVELLMVMALVALVMGFGVGALSSIDVSGRSAVGLVQSSLRSARNWAIARDAPARITIDKAAGTLAAEGLAVVGTWHFEQDPPRGAFGLNGTLTGGEISKDGFLGSALSLEGAAPGSGFVVAVHKDPAFDLSDGFVIECAVRPATMRGGRILALGRAVTVTVEARNALKVEFEAMRGTGLGARKAAGKVIMRTPPGSLPPNRWSRLMISYDREQLRVFVEGVQIGEHAEDAHVAPLDDALVVGGGRRVWEGSIDSLVISAVAVSETVQLPQGAKFGAETPRALVFWPGGNLDRTVHAEPVVISIEFDDGVRVPVRVGLYGNVE